MEKVGLAQLTWVLSGRTGAGGLAAAFPSSIAPLPCQTACQWFNPPAASAKPRRESEATAGQATGWAEGGTDRLGEGSVQHKNIQTRSSIPSFHLKRAPCFTNQAIFLSSI